MNTIDLIETILVAQNNVRVGAGLWLEKKLT